MPTAAQCREQRDEEDRRFAERFSPFHRQGTLDPVDNDPETPAVRSPRTAFNDGRENGRSTRIVEDEDS